MSDTVEVVSDKLLQSLEPVAPARVQITDISCQSKEDDHQHGAILDSDAPNDSSICHDAKYATCF